MPSRNTRKLYTPNTWYHIYNRGINKQNIFIDKEDVAMLFRLFSRYLDPNDIQINFDGMPFDKFHNELELQCYCLMSNHYHLLVKTKNSPLDMSRMMQSIWAVYTRYFNKKYERLGPLFQDRYKASPVTTEEQLLHLTKYIHLNPIDPFTYTNSSLLTYLGKARPLGWLNTNEITNIISKIDYIAFLNSDETSGSLHLLPGQAS